MGFLFCYKSSINLKATTNYKNQIKTVYQTLKYKLFIQHFLCIHEIFTCACVARADCTEFLKTAEKFLAPVNTEILVEVALDEVGKKTVFLDIKVSNTLFYGKGTPKHDTCCNLFHRRKIQILYNTL